MVESWNNGEEEYTIQPSSPQASVFAEASPDKSAGQGRQQKQMPKIETKNRRSATKA